MNTVGWNCNTEIRIAIIIVITLVTSVASADTGVRGALAGRERSLRARWRRYRRATPQKAARCPTVRYAVPVSGCGGRGRGGGVAQLGPQRAGMTTFEPGGADLWAGTLFGE